MAFGPHGPREPILAPGGGVKIMGGIVASIVAAGALFYTIRLFGTFKTSVAILHQNQLSGISIFVFGYR